MNKETNIAIIIPCYNEEDNILSLYKEISSIANETSQYHITPIFVNDCSTDNTKQLLEDNNLMHLNLSVNLGIGGAVQTGFKYAYLNGFDIAIQMDGDGQHPPSELNKLILPILNNQTDVTIGSRYLTNEGFQSTALRRFGISYFKWLNKILVGVEINDSTSGYRAINQKGMEVISDYYPDEYPEPESIILFALKNLKMIEAPVLMRERQSGKSSIRNYKTVYYMFKVTLGTIFLYIRLKFNGKRHII
ncbi:MAG: glycosyltransferase family 2 protein [Bacteroidetes bacterium]|nr:glycosyltransferase family 2 protein [Bacteroidota bacterium]